MRFLLIDKIVACDPETGITGLKNVTMSEDFLRDHFPGFPVMPGVLQIEASAQLAGWLMFARSNGTQYGCLSTIQAAKFREFIVPGSQLQITYTLTAAEEAQLTGNVSIAVDGTIKTEIKRLRVAAVPVESLMDPGQAQLYCDFISGRLPRGGYASQGAAL